MQHYIKSAWIGTVVLATLLSIGCSSVHNIVGPLLGDDVKSPTWLYTEGVVSAKGGDGKITVKWNIADDNDSPPVEYLVYLDTDNNPFDTTPSLVRNANRTVISGLPNGTTFWIGVRCRDSAVPPNVDNNTNIESAIPGIYPDYQAPTWVSSIGITEASGEDSQVLIKWNSATDDDSPPVKYLVYWDVDSWPFDNTPFDLGSSLSTYLTNLSNGQTYWFGVRCQDSASPPNTDGNSQVLSATPEAGAPPPPPLFTPNYVSSLVGLYHWDHLPALVYFNHPSNFSDMYPLGSYLTSQAAFRWNKSGQTEFVNIVSSSEYADIVVNFVPIADLDDGLLGDTVRTHVGNQMVGATVRVALTTSDLSLLPNEIISSVIAHEIGHGLGVHGHSPYDEDLMYFEVNESQTGHPTTRDFNTLKYAYPSHFSQLFTDDESLNIPVFAIP